MNSPVLPNENLGRESHANHESYMILAVLRKSRNSRPDPPCPVSQTFDIVRLFPDPTGVRTTIRMARRPS